MSDKYSDTVSRKIYLIASIAIVIGLLMIFIPDTSNVHGGGIIIALGGLFLIGLSILGLILFLLVRFLSK